VGTDNPDRRADLADRVKARRLAQRLSKDKAAERAGISPVTWTRVEDGLSVRLITYSAVESVLDWAPGNIKAALDTGDMELLPIDGARGSGLVSTADNVDGASDELTFAKALLAVREALSQLRRAAEVDPDVPADVVKLLETWNMMSVALEFGGVPGVLKVIADSYRLGPLSEDSSPRAG
jgi:transcriptional regulator with XRE-family HTH domain